MTTIPASELVNVTPNVLSAGGAALDLNALLLTASTRPPIGEVLQFPNADAVSDYFGPSSDEAALAEVYFQGFTGSNDTPGNILFAQYPSDPVAAFLRGGDISALSLVALQSLAGSLSIVIDGYVHSNGAVDLSAATSFSSAATILQTALNASPPTVASLTGVLAGNTLTASAVTGVIAVGQTLVGAGVTPGTKITALGTGTGGAGTYTFGGPTQTVASEAMTTTGSDAIVTYDSVSGGFVVTSGITGEPSTIDFATGTLSDDLLMTSLTGAVISQGAIPAVPGTFMDAVKSITQNWATFMTTFNPDETGNANRLLFAAWANGQSDRYMYVCSDDDLTATNTVPATSSLGQLIADAEYSGTYLIYSSDFNLAAFVCGIAASIDFGETDGRTTFAYRSQPGIVPSVTDAVTASNLILNGYNFYGAYATANQAFQFMQPGSVSGKFRWADSYVNQIWLNSAFQLALVDLMAAAKSIPYNTAGNAKIEAALGDPIEAGLNFGAFRPGVAPSASQALAVNAAAGVRISDVLSNRGWYLQVLSPSAAIRLARGSPECKFWYMDGESVQKIDLTSVNVQ